MRWLDVHSNPLNGPKLESKLPLKALKRATRIAFVGDPKATAATILLVKSTAHVRPAGQVPFCTNPSFPGRPKLKSSCPVDRNRAMMNCSVPLVFALLLQATILPAGSSRVDRPNTCPTPCRRWLDAPVHDASHRASAGARCSRACLLDQILQSLEGVAPTFLLAGLAAGVAPSSCAVLRGSPVEFGCSFRFSRGWFRRLQSDDTTPPPALGGASGRAGALGASGKDSSAGEGGPAGSSATGAAGAGESGDGRNGRKRRKRSLT
jgi:hypothetical protein